MSLPITDSKSEIFFGTSLKPLEGLEVGLRCWPTLEQALEFDSLRKVMPLQNAERICRH
jgi:hypothetical protein